MPLRITRSSLWICTLLIATLSGAGCQGRSATSTTVAPVAAPAAQPQARDLRGFVTSELSRFGGELLTSPPPSALDAYYPPSTPDLRYSLDMEDLYRAASYARHEAHHGRWDRAQKSWATFLQRLSVMRKQVPEWEERFGTVEMWSQALTPLFAAGRTPADADHIEKVWEPLRVRHCEECHQRERLRVIARYHYPVFYKIKLPAPDLEDPMLSAEQRSSATLSFRGYMRLLHGSMLDTLSHEEVGDLAAARLALQRTDKYLSNLHIACKMCHAMEPRLYFIDPASLALFRDLDKLLVPGEKHDTAAYRQQWEQGRNRVCTRCHDVHMLPAKLQRGWAVTTGEQRPGE